MIKQENIFKDIVDKIDYDEFIQLVEVHRKNIKCLFKTNTLFILFLKKILCLIFILMKRQN